MEENRQNFRNRENDRENIDTEDKKQFYALNLTPERIFLIFIFFIIFVSILIMIFAFVMSNSSKKRAEEIENQSEYVFTTNNSANESSLNSSNETINTLTSENTNTTSTNESQQNSQTIDKLQKKDNQTTEQTIQTKPTVNIKNETIYSSNMIKKEPVKTTSNTTINTQNNSNKKTETPSNITSSNPKLNTTLTTKKETIQNQNNQKTSYVTKYIIQIASYSTKKQAEDVGKFYSNLGYKTYIKDFVKDGKTFYRLRIGPFNEKKDAETALSKIKTTSYGKDAFISEGKFLKL